MINVRRIGSQHLTYTQEFLIIEIFACASAQNPSNLKSDIQKQLNCEEQLCAPIKFKAYIE